ncbi:MAG: hypothetical protein KF873_08710 [Gemmataceae bacterium]|nr:hypothetical protein [Gemmataceae bacterium]
MFVSMLMAVLATSTAPVPKPVKPIGAAPKIVVVAVVPGTGPVVLVTVPRTVSQTFETTVVENGAQILKKQTRDVTVTESKTVTLTDAGATFTTADGMPLTADETTTRLKEGGFLIVPADREPIDPAFRKALAAEAILVEYKKDSKASIVGAGSPMPALAAVKADDKGMLRIPAQGTREVVVKVPVSKEVDGVVKVEYVETKQTVRDLVPTPFDDVKPTVTTAVGKTVAAEDAKSRLAAGEVVLMSTNGKPVEGAYLKLVKPETLVLVSEKMVHPASKLAPAARGAVDVP